MKNKMYTAIALAILLLGTNGAVAQMTGGGGMMQEKPQEQQQMPQNPAEQKSMQGSGGYGYGMGPEMMGGYGYGMGPDMMGGYGYGMGPGMMGQYGWRQGQQPQFNSPEQYQQFLDETKDMRKKMNDLRFQYGEMMHDPSTTVGDLDKMRQEMYDLQKKIMEKAPQ